MQCDGCEETRSGEHAVDDHWLCDKCLEEDRRLDEEACPCGYFCFECLGMSWREFF